MGLVALIFAFPSPGAVIPAKCVVIALIATFFVRRWGGGISIARGFGSLVFFASLAMTACAWIAMSLAPEQEFWRQCAGALFFGGCSFVLCGGFIEAGGAIGGPGNPPPYFDALKAALILVGGIGMAAGSALLAYATADACRGC